MAAITTDQDFVLAVSYLVDTGQLPVTGERYIDAAARKVYDQRPGELVDITPIQSVLESALDAARLQVNSDTSLQNARDIALKQARKYILGQLRNPSPVATIYNTVRPVVDADPELPTMVNSLNLLATNGIPNWTLDLAGIDTDPERKRYLWLVLWLFPVLEV